MEKLFKNYGLSITLFILFAASWAMQGFFQWQEFVNNQTAHNQEVKTEEFWPEFFSATFENWQSEYLQLLSFVVLTSFLIHKGSHESKDGQDEIKKIVEEINKKLDKKKR